MIYTVTRYINGKEFLRDEDRIVADNWSDAEVELLRGITSGKYDETCFINGYLIQEISVSDDFILDVINYENNR